MAHRRPCPTPVAETLEERILHSADLTAVLGADAGAAMALQQNVQRNTAELALQSSEIAFVDLALPDADELLGDLRLQRESGRAIEIVTIAAEQDGLALISSTLAARQDITAVHVLAHGSDSQLQLGSVRLDAYTLLARAGEVASWGSALAGDADLLLYGCDFAQTSLGQALVRDLAALTGADVAASTDRTGAAALGGDWELEYRSGLVEAALAPSLTEQSVWRGVLATYTVTTTSDLFLALLPQAGTFRWAVGQANSNPGTDTIVFAVNGSFGLNSLGSGGDDNSDGDFDVLGSVNIVGNGTGNTIITGDGNDRALDLRSGTIAISGLTVQGGNNSTGGGIAVRSSANVTLTDVVVQNNFGSGASKGAGIYNDGVLTLRNVIVQNNGNVLEKTDGAGIYVDHDAVLDARDVEIRNNIAFDKDGGGIYSKDNNTTRLENVTLAANSAKNGGGIYIDKLGTTLVNVTLSGNVASDRGGGMFANDVVTLDHVTIANNSAAAGSGGGIYDNTSGSVTIRNSLFAGNSGGNTNLALVSQGYNLSDDNSAGFVGTGDLKNVAAGLSPLASNGGFTRTHAISAGSAAVNAANPVTSLSADQRGIAYFGGRSDVGAFERNPFGFSPTVSAIAGQSAAEDTALGPIAFTISDTETAAGSLLVSTSSSNPALVPDGNIVIGGSGANRTISLTPAANANSSANGGPVTITVTVSDGGNLSTTSFLVTVTAVNDAASVGLPGPQSVAEDGILVLSGANAPVITDVDAGATSVQLTLAVAHGLLTLSQTTGLSFVTGTGSNNASMTLTGSLAAINAALAGLQYRPVADYNGPDQLSFTVNDLGNSGSGGARVTNASLSINVNAGNDAPALALPGAQVTPQPTPLDFSGANGNAITLSDVDAGSAVVQVVLSTTALGNGTLSLGSSAGLTLVTGMGTSDLLLQGALADINAALATLRFSATAAGAARIDISADDLGNSPGPALQASGSVAILVDNDAPPQLVLARTSLVFTEGDAATLLDSNLDVIDVDNATLASARIRFTAGFAGAQDELRFTANGATMGNIAGSYNAGELTLSSAGATATLAQWRVALRSVAYLNLSDAPVAGPRTLSLSVNDSLADSAAESFTITVAPVNDAPVLAGANALAAITEDDPSNFGTLVSTLVAGQVSELDAGAAAGIAVTGVDDTNGTWQYSINGGGSWSAFGVVDDTNARLLGADADTLVRFVPAADWNGMVGNGLTFRAWDQSSGAAGATADASSNGGSTAFSAATAGSSVLVAPVNDAPVLAGANNLATILEDETANPGTLVSALIAGQTSDVDAAPLTGIAVTAVDSGVGTWQYSVDGGGSWLAFGAVSDGAARLLAGDALTFVRLVPNTNWNGSVTGGLGFRAWDQTTGSAGAVADASSNGAGTAFSSAVASSGITVSPVNDAPTLAEAITDQAATQGVGFSFQVPVETFVEVDAGDTLSYSATLSGGAALPSWLSFNAATRTFSGTPANADVGSITVRVTATDSASASVFDDFTIAVANVNDAPTLATPIPDQAATQGSAFSFTFGAGSFADVDVGDTLSYSATLSGGAALPSWLSFNAATRTFSGTPANADVGSITLRVTATDSASASVFDDFVIAVANVNDAPTVATPIPDQSATQGSAFSFTFGAGSFADVDVGDTLSYSATLSGGGALPSWLSFNAATGTFSGTPANADVGSVTLRVTATDGSAASVFDDFTIAVANVNDAPTVATPIPDQAATQGSAFSFTFGAGSFADVDVGDTLSYSATLSGGAALPSWLSFNAATRTFSGTPGNADVGSISLRVTATDSASASVFDDFTIAVANVNDAPTLATPIADQAATQGSAFSFTFGAGSFADVDAGDTLSYSATLSGGAALPSWLSFNAATRTFSGTPANADVGSISVRVTATDGSAASVFDDFTIAVANVNDAPTVATPIADQAATQGSAFSFTFGAGSFADVDVGDTLSYSATLSGGGALPSWLSFNAATRTFSGTPANADVGSISVRVTATDGSVASVFDDFVIAVANVNDAPTVATPIPDQSATQGSAFSFTFGAGSFADVDVGDTLSYSATLSGGGALPSWLSFNAATRTFSGTPANADVGSISLRVTATDSASASVFDDFTIAVANVNDAPTVATPIPDQSATQGSAFSFTFGAGSFADVDVGDTLSYSATLSGGAALPSWLSFNAATRTFSGTPANADVGSVTLRVTATDASGASAFDDFSLGVTNTNGAPTLVVAIADQAATEDDPFAFTVPGGSFADVDAGDTLTYSATLPSGAALPSWLSFNAATRTFSGTPLNADVGTITLRVTATDASGASAFDDFTLAVTNTNDAPTLVATIADQAATEDTPFTFTVPGGSFADVDAGDTLTYSATLSSGAALPSWLGFNAATRTFSGTPLNADVGSLTVRVTTSDGDLARSSGDFVLTITNVNDVPLAVGRLPPQEAILSAPWAFQLPAAAFSDPDSGDALRYGATLADGGALPAWLKFDALSRTFSGVPTDSDVGNFIVRVVATDNAGAAAQTLFVIAVVAPPLPSSALDVETVAARPTPPEPPRDQGVPAAAAEVPPVVIADGAPASSERAAELPPPLTIESAAVASVRSETQVADVTIGSARASDSVLAAAVDAQFDNITVSSSTQMFKDDGMLRKLEEMRRQMQLQGEERRTLVASTIAVTSGLSIGYVVWLVRGGVLVGSMLSALPAWQMIDPLPVVAASRAKKAKSTGAHPEPDDPEVERLFGEAAPTPAAALPTAPPPAPSATAAPDGTRQ